MKTKARRVLSWWPSTKALAAACVVGLLALALTALGIVMPKPILVVASMSVAQGLGAVAFVLYLITVTAEYKRDTGKIPRLDSEQKPEQS